MMLNKILILSFALISSFTFGQISFEKGYFINKDDVKVECLIKNMDWKNNPSSFEYKLSELEEVLTNEITYVKEFAVYGDFKFVRKTVMFDKADENLSSLSEVGEAEFEERQVFLKVLIEGLASLYFFDDSFSKKYFYSMGDENPSQLMHKKYLVSRIKVKTNNNYKTQLINAFICDDISFSRFDDLIYNKKDLMSIFTDFNNCKKSAYINYVKARSKSELFNFSIKSGLTISSFSFTESSFLVRNYDFGKKENFRIGIEAEIIFPYNKNKWALFVEPTYQSYNSEINKNIYLSSDKIQYKSIEMPIGWRHYIFLNDTSKLFVNASFVFDIPISSNISLKTEGRSTVYDLQTDSSWAFGLGYKIGDRYSVECKFQTTRHPLNGYKNLFSKYTSTTVVLGYTLF